ncbi:hypothetical protein UFOVP916_27 [uncultured Caudovirales phage]|uniref:Uncharacterized protein n=1 Tax=uncultured Caudovirales phage TaxID=2100421 RepID=A0A6J5P297_9CAUD|nr:hypothetical protein UFOVP827_48 [uncultured Caudovirales phage]CAB4171456.1 hypothetical protein UFOVP916_27 [uncultured Caudovirales phage]CAB4177443.1 hypothetical protein UFOVP1001_51 [uncultured Caudovirales phage]CAB4199190.1 hypothetical protein UFOVP1338_25 [uncultured Caudovirales phage]CAB4213386.1 hypothetical protein UFOVP1447_20 [uncultured Caudovirales phage]
MVLFENTVYPIIIFLGIWLIAEIARMKIAQRKLKNTYRNGKFN